MQARGRVHAGRSPLRRLLLGLVAVATGTLLVPSGSSAHLERPSYWPDPGPDTSVSPPAGGKVPKARSLTSALTGKGPGEVRVACKSNSLALAERSIAKAKRRGFRIRPSQPKRKLSAAKASKLGAINRVLFRRCAFRSVQKAINRSGNNDRVVIMPGRYREARSRKAPVNDPKCSPDLLQEDQSGALTPSYEYQATCPNDQNLIYVQGRAVKGEPLASPDPDRHGIPPQELGRCIRCNLQVEGSGVIPEDVILDAGRGYSKARNPQARPGGETPASECLAAPDGPENPCYAKHVVMRTDRSDGFVGRNFLMRGAKEHGFYTEETDGILLDRVKFFWNADYGHLSFTTDHNVVKRCDGFGSGDAVVYPGAAPQTGEFRDTSFYPDERYNTVIKQCDLHGSAMGYSGSMGNSVRVTRNRFYGNANGLTSDTLSAPGHPGFPSDGMKVDRNWFYSNNLNIYRHDSPFEALVPQAIGTGIMWPGMNDGVFTKNRVFDNWSHGTLLIAIPDVLAGEAEGNVDPQFHCAVSLPNLSGTTSCDNRYFENDMGNVPDAFRKHPGLRKFGNRSRVAGADIPDTAPNGVDFWWDEYPTNDGNCWFDNRGAGGGSVTSDPPAPLLPSNCGASLGNPITYAAKVVVLLSCFAEWETGNAPDGGCYWYDMPPPPGTAAAAAQERRRAAQMKRIAQSPEAQRLEEHFRELLARSRPG